MSPNPEIEATATGSVYELIATNTQFSAMRRRAGSEDSYKPTPEQLRTPYKSNATPSVTVFAAPTLAAAVSDGPVERRRRAQSESDVQEEAVKRRYKYAYSFWHA